MMKKKAYAGGGVGMKKKSYAGGGVGMKKKMMSRGGKMPMATDPKTGKKVPAFAIDGVGKMAKGGASMKKKMMAGGGAMKKKMMAGGGAMKKKSYAVGGMGTAMVAPKTKKTRTGTVVPTMMPPMNKMKNGGMSKKKVSRGR